MFNRIKKDKPTNYLLFGADIETAKDGSVLMIGSMGDDGDYRTFTTWEEAIKYWWAAGRKDRRKTVVYFHNGGKFDIVNYISAVLTDASMPAKFFLRKVIVSGSRVVIVKVGNTRWQIELRDSYASLPSSLENLAKTYGIPGKAENELVRQYKEDMGTLFEKHRDVFDEYLKQDCYILKQVIDRVFKSCYESYGIYPRATAASTAMAIFRSNFLRKDYVLTSGMTLKFEEYAYQGGLCLDFAHGEYKDVTHLDINSAYPFAMRSLEFPTMKGILEEGWEGIRRDESGKINHCLAFVHYRLDKTKTPFAFIKPWVVREENRLANCLEDGDKDGYPHKVPAWEGYAWLYHHELQLVEEYGEILEVGLAVRYDCSRPKPWLREFTDTIWAKRLSAKESGDKATDQLCKLTLNSFSGKTGQKRIRDKIEILDKVSLKEGTVFIDVGTKALLETKEEVHPPYIAPVIVGMITSATRAYLIRTIMEVYKAGGVVVYCDTDSVMFTGKIPESLPISSKELGAFKHEGTGSFKCAGRKLYFSEVKGLAAKGVDKENNGSEIIDRLLRGELVPITNKRPMGFKEMLSKFERRVWAHGRSPSEFLDYNKYLKREPSLLERGLISDFIKERYHDILESNDGQERLLEHLHDHCTEAATPGKEAPSATRVWKRSRAYGKGGLYEPRKRRDLSNQTLPRERRR